MPEYTKKLHEIDIKFHNVENYLCKILDYLKLGMRTDAEITSEGLWLLIKRQHDLPEIRYNGTVDLGDNKIGHQYMIVRKLDAVKPEKEKHGGNPKT